jgi:hypothetical protein
MRKALEHPGVHQARAAQSPRRVTAWPVFRMSAPVIMPPPFGSRAEAAAPAVPDIGVDARRQRGHPAQPDD